MYKKNESAYMISIQMSLYQIINSVHLEMISVVFCWLIKLFMYHYFDLPLLSDVR